MKKLTLLLGALCFVFASCCNNAEQTTENGVVTEQTEKCSKKECPKDKCCKKERACCPKMTEEERAEMEAFKAQWKDWENQTEEVKKELIDKAICKINAKEAFKKEMEAKIAEMETKWQNISSLSLEEQKEVIDWKMGKRCCKKQKCDKAPAHPCK